jgi:DNA helicase II / ATP-dependent DNA helicase PcrA
MKNLILLAGPGTGKTRKVSKIIEGNDFPKKILIVSFTNAVVADLLRKFESIGITSHNCMTLHKLSFRLKNDVDKNYVLQGIEEKYLEKLAEKMEVETKDLYEFLGVTTYDQMIQKSVDFLQESHPEFITERLGDIDLFIVDEYQDFGPVEQQLVLAISKYVKQTIILGDDDQCIYGFKDAEVEGIISLHNDKDSFEVIEHEHICYRCPEAVVKVSKKLIDHNINRVNKEWKPLSPAKEGNVQFYNLKTKSDVDTTVIESIKGLVKEDKTGIMVLAPFSSLLSTICEALGNEGIEYSNLNAVSVPEGLYPAVWLLKYCADINPLVNLLFLTDKHCRETKKYDWITKKLIPAVKEQMSSYTKAQRKKVHSDTIEAILALSILSKEDAEIISAKSDLEDLVVNERFTDLISYVDEEDVKQSIEDIFQRISETNVSTFKENGVNLMTIHKSKGLEAEHVFILGLVQGVLPSKLGTDEIEAQRRLLFVGMTRAKKNLHLLSNYIWDSSKVFQGDAGQFRNHGRNQKSATVSRFIREMGLL